MKFYLCTIKKDERTITKCLLDPKLANKIEAKIIEESKKIPFDSAEDYQVIMSNQVKLSKKNISEVPKFKELENWDTNTKAFPSVNTFKDIISKEKGELLYYFFEITIGDITTLYIKKVTKSYVQIEDKEVKKTYFKARLINSQLVEASVENNLEIHLNFECILRESNFYILGTRDFEKLAGLEEEVKKVALDEVDKFKQFSFIKGLENVNSLVSHDQNYQRKVMKIGQFGNIEKLKDKEVQKSLLKASKLLKLKMKIENDEFHLTNEYDAQDFIKLVVDDITQSLWSKNILEHNDAKVRTT